ncbi:MAG: CRISPR-associated protein [Bacteroidales bacterium]|nr:CRISPR-associated protein [Bacteroidales bacterium]
MLINLSNHPSAAWTLEQKAEYKEIIDLPFPQVDPEGDEGYIDSLVNEYLQKIEQISNIEAVHIMGEFNFCYKMINELKKKNIKCVASCTKRDTVEENGVKISKFKFVRFREY